MWASADAQTDPTGVFKLTLPAPGDFLVSVEREGYYALKDRAVHVDGTQEMTLVINSVREVFQSENVNAETSPVDVGQTQSQERLTGTEVNDMPYANSHSLRNSLQLMPGVVQDATGTLHVNGSSENQVLYLLNGFQHHQPDFRPVSDASGGGRHPFGRPFFGPHLRRSSEKGRPACWPSTPRTARTHSITRRPTLFPDSTSSKVCTSETGIRDWASPDRSCAGAPGSPIRSIRNTANRW